MNGIHDCGGMQGFGPIEMEGEDAPKFKQDWERDVFGLHWAIAMLGNWGIDDIRHAMERMGNVEYVSTSYYEHWFACNEILLVEHGIMTSEEYEAEKAHLRTDLDANLERGQGQNVMTKEVVLAALETGDCAKLDSDLPPKFKVGDVIRTKNWSPKGHTRLTRYIKDQVGVIKIDHGVYPLPDAPDRPQHVYSVEFKASDLWDEANPIDTLRIDLWDDYMMSEGG